MIFHNKSCNKGALNQSYQTHLSWLLHFMQLFLWMQENKKLDVYSYSHYIKFMANKLDASTMLKLYNDIQVESAKDNVYVCNSVLSCLIKKGKFDTTMKLFRQMKHDGLVPDLVTYSTVCNSFLHCFCSLVTYTNWISACLKQKLNSFCLILFSSYITCTFYFIFVCTTKYMTLGFNYLLQSNFLFSSPAYCRLR